MAVELPLPPKELSPNARCHYHAKARAVKEYRTTSAIYAREAMGRYPAPHLESARIKATFLFETNRRRDPDNLLASLKPAFDGLRDAGILKDDNQIEHAPVDQTIVEKGMGEGVLLQIWSKP
jgi:crossover junction endodeoxyribonuclease RusA